MRSTILPRALGAGFVQSLDMVYILSLDILYSCGVGTGVVPPAIEDRRALEIGLQFAN
jgi:hypothetical protein